MDYTRQVIATPLSPPVELIERRVSKRLVSLLSALAQSLAPI